MKESIKQLKNISLKTELYVNLMAIVIVSVIATGFFAYNIAQDSIRDQTVKGMDFAVENKEGQVFEFLEHTGTQAKIFASDGFILNSTERAMLGDAEAARELNVYLASNKLSLDETLLGINIIDREGYVVASSHGGELGRSVSPQYLEQIKSLERGEFYVSDIEILDRFGDTGPVMRVFSPIVDLDSGETVAFIVNYENTDTLDDIMLQLRKEELGAFSENSELLKTLNVYIINKDGYIITESKYGDYIAFEEHVSTTPYRNCREGRETADIYTNYKNVSVVGASTCLRNGWALVAELNEEEALAGIRVIQQNIIFVAGILLVLSAVIAYFLTQKNVKPIYSLLRTVRSFKEGNFASRAEVGSMNEVGHLTEEFNKMADRLEELDRMKSEFLSFVSHEYKNPLSVLSLNTELLLEDKTLNEEQKNILRTNLDTIKEINNMVDNFLNVSRIELGVFETEKEDVDLEYIADGVLDKFLIVAKNKGVELAKNYSKNISTIKTDPEAVRMIMDNLVSNAVKYTPKGGKIALELEKEDNSMIIRVLDTGYGIPEKDQPYIFSKFFRAKNIKDGKTEGTGLGLYMAKVITEKIGGKIWFHSREKTGTTFYVSLPVKKQA